LLRPDGTLPLQGLIEAQARHLPRGSTVVLITPSASEAVVGTADILLRRGLRPVAVLLDAATFGGYFSSSHLVDSMKALGVPVCNVANGADLSNVLSEATSSAQWN
jgi:hypothetical protein